MACRLSTPAYPEIWLPVSASPASIRSASAARKENAVSASSVFGQAERIDVP